VCVCVCVYIHICVCIYIYAHIHIHRAHSQPATLASSSASCLDSQSCLPVLYSCPLQAMRCNVRVSRSSLPTLSLTHTHGTHTHTHTHTHTRKVSEDTPPSPSRCSERTLSATAATVADKADDSLSHSFVRECKGTLKEGSIVSVGYGASASAWEVWIS